MYNDDINYFYSSGMTHLCLKLYFEGKKIKFSGPFLIYIINLKYIKFFSYIHAKNVNNNFND